MDTLQDTTMGPPSPSKGKSSDANNKTWRAGWWDFYPLLERPKRPLHWTQSSIIFTAHPAQALITGHHFSSSKQFVLPSPAPIFTSPTQYEPPSLVSSSPSDQWLFAYFPGRDGDGVGCLWKRGNQIDNWLVNEYWSYPKYRGAMAVTWLGGNREWAFDVQGNPTRLPMRGPRIPISDPTLIIVTEDNSVHLTYMRHYQSGIKCIKRHLCNVGGVSTEQTLPIDLGDDTHTRRCLDAAIGLGYGDSTIYVATHTTRVPPPMRQVHMIPQYTAMDLSVPVGTITPDQTVMEWETWGDEHTIEIFEVNVRFDGTNLVLFSSLINTQECRLPIVDMAFSFSLPPPSSSADTTSTPKRTSGEKGKVMLVTSAINFGDYSEPPTSTLTSYSITPRPTANGTRNLWSVQREPTWKTESGIVSYIQPFLDVSKPNVMLMYTCILNSSGSLPTEEREATIGTIKVLALPDCSEDNDWDSSLIKYSVDHLGRDVPLFSLSSPNKALLCSIPFSLTKPRITIHPLPHRKPLPSSISIIPHKLAAAILGRVTTSDIMHPLCSPSAPLSEVTDVIYHTLDILDKHFKSEMPKPMIWEVLGIASDIYSGRSLRVKDDKEVELLKDLHSTAHDMCSIAACNMAFEDCKEKDGYDLESAWQIISISIWVVNFTEKVMKACVLSSNLPIMSEQDVDMQFIDSDAISLPILLHACHPFALQNFIAALKHVKNLRTFLGHLPAGGEHARAAQAVLIDTVDCSGVNFAELIALLETSLDSTQKYEAIECRRSLAACRPTPIMQPQLLRLLLNISQSETILNKSTLFIKPSDLVDGITRISFSNQRKTEERDVVTKSSLDQQYCQGICSRCGGKTSVVPSNLPSLRNKTNAKWIAWEYTWQLRCICGGSWLSVATN